LDKTQRSTNHNVPQLFHVIEQRSLEREIDRVRHELGITEKKIIELEQRVKIFNRFFFGIIWKYLV
jgi:hypothetical protein